MLSGPECLQVYIHCTAGLGRAPAACIAWMYWFGDRQLDEVGAYLDHRGPRSYGCTCHKHKACAVHHEMSIIGFYDLSEALRC